MINVDKVILVDEFDNELGTMEKLRAHTNPVLHRAISVFILDSNGNWLIQKRHSGKYHSAGMWSNTCCSHPAPCETAAEAASRRLKYEMGINAELSHLFHFIYRADLDNGLTEYELDHVFQGICDDVPAPHAEEVEDYQYIAFDKLAAEIKQYPENFSEWFKMIYERVNEELNYCVCGK